MGSVRMAALLEMMLWPARVAAWPGGTRPAPVCSQREPGPGSLLRPKKKSICSNRGEPVSTEQFSAELCTFQAI